MDDRKYELLLAETAAELPPVDSELSEPWSHAMRLILWGLALVTFRLGLLGLQYILPCVGSVLVFLATMFTKQHVFYDVISGVAVAEIGWLVARYTGLPRLFERLNGRFLRTKLAQMI